MNRMIRN